MDDIKYTSPNAQVEGYMKSKKSENIGVRVSKVMSMDINTYLPGSGADSVAEFIRLAIAEKLSSISVADRVQQSIGDISEGLVYTREKIESAVDDGSNETKKLLIKFLETLQERDKKFAEAMSIRDKGFKEISENMLQITELLINLSTNK